jgi:cytochrome c
MNERSAIRLVVLMITLAVSHTGGAQTMEPYAVTLMRDHKCYVCHGDDEELMGPAFVDVGAKYRGNPHAVAIIAGRVRVGAHSGGPWHMPPHPEVSPAEARIIARHILSLDQPRIRSAAAAPREQFQSAATISPRP